MSTKETLYYDGKPPVVSGVYAVVSTTTSNAAAANWDWVTAVGGLSLLPGPVWVILQAGTNHCHVRFKPTNAAAGTTLTNGMHVGADAPVPSVAYWVDPVQHRFIDHIAQTGAGTLQLHVSSSPLGRSEQSP